MGTSDNWNPTPTGTQAAPEEINPGEIQDAALQLQTALTRLAQKGEQNDEGLAAFMKQAGEEIRLLDSKLLESTTHLQQLDDRTEHLKERTEYLRELIRSMRP